MTATPNEQTIAASPPPAGARAPADAPASAAAPGLTGPRAPSAAPSPPTPGEPDGPYEACDQCGSPVDASQRYCVVCVVSHTNFGAAHQVDGFKPTAKQLSSGAQIVKRESKQINNNYVQAQKGLPDSVSVP